MSEYAILETIIEDPVAKFKTELESLGLFARIDEGEEIYDGDGAWAIVLPGIDSITLEGNQQLLHNFNLYALLLKAASPSALKDLRLPAEKAYDKLMEDTSHGGTCWNCLPVHWDPGFMKMDEYTFAGVQSLWRARNYQTFPLPSGQASCYTRLEDLIEEITQQIKDEVADVDGIDEVNEGEKPYEGGGVVAWVIPGLDRTEPFGRAKLLHRLTIYQNFLASSGSMTLAEMRKIGEAAYDKIMEDVSLSQKCALCLPRSWHAGFMEITSELRFVGIQAIWDIQALQTYTPT